MDRFIAAEAKTVNINEEYLKSNMDRFIGYRVITFVPSRVYLKSNMDRFIEITPPFKIK